MKKLLFIPAYVFCLIDYSCTGKQRIPLNQLSFTKSVFNKEQNKVTFKGGKWDSFIKLPASINQELSEYKFMIIDIPQSTVMIRIKFEGTDGLYKEFINPL